MSAELVFAFAIFVPLLLLAFAVMARLSTRVAALEAKINEAFYVDVPGSSE